MPGLIERFRDRLPFDPGDPVVSMGEGSTPLVRADHVSELVGREVWLKLEGLNPTGSFKDRGMTCAVSAAVREGAEAVICASTGNTAASAAAYAGRAGLTGAVIVPEGKIAHRQARPGADARRARDRAARQLRPGARARARARARATRSRSSTRVNPFRLEGQKTAAFEVLEELGGDVDAVCLPVGNAGNITAYWKGFGEVGAAPRMYGFQAEGAAPLVTGRRSRSPRPSPARSASATRRAGRRR